MRLAFFACAMVLVALPLAAQEKGKAEEGFVSLFDGTSLEGWQGNLDVFSVRDGAIVGGSLKAPVARNEFLTAKKEYGDFELRLEFKLLGEKANAGVQIRSQRIPNHHEMSGYQADLGDGWWGCLYDESRRNKILAGPEPAADRGKIVKKDQWNDYRILCEGRRIRLWINGQPTVDYTEPDAAIPQKGLIGVQIHGGGPSEAWYRNVRIKELRD
ncbi:MAG: 3-keto-disaccharide hydrolase [Thermoguttaceae bacterium]